MTTEARQRHKGGEATDRPSSGISGIAPEICILPHTAMHEAAYEREAGQASEPRFGHEQVNSHKDGQDGEAESQRAKKPGSQEARKPGSQEARERVSRRRQRGDARQVVCHGRPILNCSLRRGS